MKHTHEAGSRNLQANSNDELWVGSWRPHRPRGPIAALYGSPGPKYALPGLIGASQHDPTKYKAPMFSFGARREEVITNCSPGPRYQIPQNITRKGKSGTPAFSLLGRPKQLQLSIVPGPGQQSKFKILTGQYSPERSGKITTRSAPAYSLSGRRKDRSNSQTPGPDAYTLPPMLGCKTVVAPSAPNYTLQGRSKTTSFNEDPNKTPGPAAYKVVNPSIYRQKPPQYSIKGRNFVPEGNTQKPGPGAYFPERVTFTRAKAPSFSFGMRHSQYIAPLVVNVNE
ncbi:outer dense fiber protein 3-B isoform X1 [Cyprinodon tularosa]|uniref:outer dense fiber protein 3-B isoform X1 n=1 Tax=Cyprinodon tularosa TaxID=77115 RepID=UPI0018E24BCE|nr:outer dense fiber protein 3-B isoform X1 [Cyprinodon tularosa]